MVQLMSQSVTADLPNTMHARMEGIPPSGAVPIVTVRDLSKIYRQGEINVTALDRISLTINKGEFLTLMGPSG